MNAVSAEELDVIAPASTTVTVVGLGEVTIAPLKLGQVPGFLRALRGVPLESLSALKEGGLSEGIGVLFALMQDHGDELILAASIAAKVKLEQMRELELDDALLLVATCMRVNADFFANRLVPALEKMSRQMPAARGDGATASAP